MYDSGEIQDVGSNYSGRLSFVSGQFAMVPSSRSMLSRDKRLPLDTWNIILDCRKTFFGNQFSTFDPPEIIIHSCASQREQGSVPQEG